MIEKSEELYSNLVNELSSHCAAHCYYFWNSVGDHVSSGIGLFKACSKNSSIGARIPNQVQVMGNAVFLMINNAGSLRRQVQSEHSPLCIMFVLTSTVSTVYFSDIHCVLFQHMWQVYRCRKYGGGGGCL